jgi:hypothetical protein
VIDEHTAPRGLEAQYDLFTGINQRQVAATQGAGGGVEVDIVLHRVGRGIDERQLHIVAFVHDHHWSGNRAVEIHGPKPGAVVIDDDLLFFGHQPEFHDLCTLRGRLLVRMHEGWRDKLDPLPRQREILGQGPLCEHRGQACKSAF